MAHDLEASANGVSPRSRTAFVTGATGFLGLNLVECLIKAGWTVTALHRASSDTSYLTRFPCRLSEGSIEDAASLERAVPEAVDVVFHVAGDVSFWSRHRDRQTRTNVDGTRNVVAAALRRGAKLVHTSSTAVYGFQPGPFDETAAHLGKSSWFHYMHTKALAEEEIRAGIARGLQAVCLNPANIIGRYDRHNWARLIILAANGRLPSIPPGRGSFCHATEVARAHIAAAERGRCGENYILAGADASFAEVIRTIGELVRRPVRSKVARPRFLRTASRILGLVSLITRREPLLTPESAAFLCADLTCRSNKAERELGYSPSSLRTMLQDCHHWLVEEGILKQPASST
jgi:nucleoside-diphosphate-sugar epimerase